VRSLVTGATGFLGSRLARLLCDAGDDVRVLARPTSDRRRIADLPVQLAEGDVTDRASVEDAVKGAERVFHAAAYYELGDANYEAMRAVNVGGTRNVLEAATGGGAAVVHVSSVMAHGGTGAEPEDETYFRDGEPGSPYEATKREAHVLAARMGAAGAAVRIASPATIYGPDDPSRIGTAHRWMVRGLPVGILPKVRLAMVHVDDCAAGLVAINERGRDGEDYILGGDLVTFAEWFATAARAGGHRPPLVYVPDWIVRAAGPLTTLIPVASLRRLLKEGIDMASQQHFAYSSEKASRELGWTWRSLDEGMRDVAAFYA
jgi:dihydroflavonol-4-reductase